VWLTYKAVKYVKCKHRIFRKYKDKNHPACMRASRNASREVKKISSVLKRNWLRILRRILNRFLPMFVDDSVQREN